MKPEKKSLSPKAVRALSAFAVVAVAAMVITDWLSDADGEGPSVDAATWLGAFFGGFAGVLFSLFAVLFLLGVVLKLFDRMR